MSSQRGTGTLGRVRTIRPRPVNAEERLPVVFLNRKRDPDQEPLDPGLVEFLRTQEAEFEAQRATEKKHKRQVRGRVGRGGGDCVWGALVRTHLQPSYDQQRRGHPDGTCTV